MTGHRKSEVYCMVEYPMRSLSLYTPISRPLYESPQENFQVVKFRTSGLGLGLRIWVLEWRLGLGYVWVSGHRA